MSSFVPILWSKIKLGKPSFSVVECKIHTNYSLHEATDQTPHDSVQQQQVLILFRSMALTSAGSMWQTVSVRRSEASERDV